VSAGEPDSVEETKRRHSRAIRLLTIAASTILIVDQLTKWWAVENLPEGQAVEVIGEFLQWFFVRNPGAAFSFAAGATWIFTILAFTVGVAIVWFARRLGSIGWALFLGLLLGGTLGNLTDRLFRTPGFPQGHVVDFISTPWMMPAIYNIADIAIVTSVGIFVIVSIRGIGIDGSRQTRVIKAETSEQ